jgi:hypothetical protein
MKRKVQLILSIFLGINIILNAWTVIHKDIIFNSDIARDFLLLNEISQKKIVLIGPRADGIQGLFHGPLWLYINYPVYYLSHGNPLAAGWFWFFLTICFLLESYFISSKLFNRNIALAYVTLLSGFMVYHSNNLFNPDGILFLLPAFLLFLTYYYKQRKFIYLIISLFIVGLMIQFQMAIGVPFLILTAFLSFYLIKKNKQYTHLLAFIILLIPLSTFILFDLRHNFEQLHSIINNFSGHTIATNVNFVDRLSNRIIFMTSQLFFFNDPFSVFNIALSYFFAFFLWKRITATKDHNHYYYLLFLYFYLGFYAVSLLLNGDLLTYFVYPLVPLTFLIFTSFISYNEKIVTALIVVVAFLQIISGIQFVTQAVQGINADPNSWQFQHNLALRIFNSTESSSGYLIYAPDVLGYKQKYAFVHTKSQYPEKNVTLFRKQRITYVVVEPIPGNRLVPGSQPVMTNDYTNWRKYKVTFKGKLLYVYTYPNGYRIEEYLLSQQESNSPIDSTLSDIIHFR